jgi:pyruvate dehydrogenase E1 component alpha subunit
LIEALTYRFVGHSRGDPPHGLYRSKDEYEQWRERDPLTVLARTAELSDDECTSIRAESRQIMEQAIETSRGLPDPVADRAMREIWGG